MKKIFFPFLVTCCMISCDKKSKDIFSDKVSVDSAKVISNEPEVSEAVDPALEIKSMCYQDILRNDSVYLKIEDNLGTIVGKLRYKNQDKNNSNGDISGIKNGDTLKLDYTFQSEGKTSTREIWLLEKNGKLLEGVTDYDKSGEKYANPKKIKFEGAHEFSVADCKDFDKNFE